MNGWFNYKIAERGRDKSMWIINQTSIPLEEQEEFDYDTMYHDIYKVRRKTRISR